MKHHSGAAINFACGEYYAAMAAWELCEDCFRGERAIKAKGDLYLPRTDGQLADPVYGGKRYANYRSRANFYNYFASTVYSLIGLIHREPVDFSGLPQKLSCWQDRFTLSGDSLQRAAGIMNYFQLVYGRCGIMLDPVCGSGIPLAAIISPRRILDWESSDGITRFLLIDESCEEFNYASKRKTPVSRLRVCALDKNGDAYSRVISSEEYADFDLLEAQPDKFYPKITGRRSHRVPFIFVNAGDTDCAIQLPPLLPLANLCIAIYRGDADYRHSLYMQGQATLFLKGFTLDFSPMTGGGNYIHTTSPDADGKFLEVSGNGLSEMRLSQNDLHSCAKNMGVLLEEEGSSGKALEIQLAMRSTLLKMVSGTAVSAVRSAADIAGQWMNS